MRIKNWKYLIIIFLPIQWLIFYVITQFPDFIENEYSTGFYVHFSSTLRLIFGITNFPIGLLLFYALIVISIFYISRFSFKVIKQKSERKAILKTGITNTFTAISIIYFVFMLFWGLNYHRYKLDKIMGFDSSEIKQEELLQVCDSLIITCNKLRAQIKNEDKISFTKTCEEALDGYYQISKNRNELTYKNESIKPAFIPKTFSYIGISGVYFPFTGEALINSDIPKHLLPATISHEMAHQVGFSAEDEANFISYLACIKNKSIWFQYSGNFLAMRYAVNSIKNDSIYKVYYSKISVQVKQDILENKLYWKGFDTPISSISESLNDLFLKANNQKDGVNSYGLMTKLLVKEFRLNKTKH